MEAERFSGGLYRISVEGDLIWLREGGFVTAVVAQWREDETQGGLVQVTAEQLEKLRPLLRVREIVPADDGIYADRDGWHAVRQGEVLASGRHGQVPTEMLRSISEAPPAGRPTIEARASAPPTGSTSVLEQDPVCGMTLRPGQEVANVNYEGRTYHFCSNECRELFLKDPKAYVNGPIGQGQPIAR